MTKAALIFVMGAAFGVLLYDTQLDRQRAARAPMMMPAAAREPLMQHPLPDCATWVAQRGANERWARRCAPAADLTRKGL